MPRTALVVERYVLAAVAAGTLAALLLVSKNDLAPLQHPVSFGLVYWKWFLAMYGVVALLSLALALGVARAPRLASTPRVLLAVMGLAFAALALIGNPRSLAMLNELGGPTRYRWLCPAGLALAVLALVMAVLLPLLRPWPPRVAAVLAVATTYVALTPTSPPSAPPPPAPKAGRTGERFLLFGIDGADWTYLEPLLARGELPNLAMLRDEGVWGPLETLQPAKSPAVWTTIATGMAPRYHGITDFSCRQLRGVNGELPKLRPVLGVGFGQLQSWLEGSGRLFRGPITGLSRKVPAFWNLATAEGSPVAVVNWWATWPAEPILGSVVSQRVHYWRFAIRDWPWAPERITHPARLYEKVAGLVVTPDQVTAADAAPFMDVAAGEFEAAALGDPARSDRLEIVRDFRRLYSMFETNRRIALRVVELGREDFGSPPDMLLLSRVVDFASHLALGVSELESEPLGASEEERRRLGGLVSEAYRSADRFLGELIDAFGEGNVVVVSDHGFELMRLGPERADRYGHLEGPDGIFIAAGPAFGRGRVEGLSVYEVFPLLAYLKGFPLASDLEGRLAAELFDKDFRARHPVRRVATYDESRYVVAPQLPEGVEEEMMDDLKALGYVE